MGRLASRMQAISTNHPSLNLGMTPLRDERSMYLARPQSVLIQRKALGEFINVFSSVRLCLKISLIVHLIKCINHAERLKIIILRSGQQIGSEKSRFFKG